MKRVIALSPTAWTRCQWIEITYGADAWSAVHYACGRDGYGTSEKPLSVSEVLELSTEMGLAG